MYGLSFESSFKDGWLIPTSTKLVTMLLFHAPKEFVRYIRELASDSTTAMWILSFWSIAKDLTQLLFGLILIVLSIE